MRKVILYIATSLDGYIAREDGKVDWLSGDGSDPSSDYGYEKFYETVDTVIMGRTSYDQIIDELSPDKWVYEDKDSYVVTTKQHNEDKNVKFITEDVCDFIKELKGIPGENIWIVGGSKLVDTLMKKNLIDEYIITVIPTILGNGMSLFKGNNPEIKLRLKETSAYNGAVMMHYVNR